MNYWIWPRDTATLKLMEWVWFRAGRQIEVRKLPDEVQLGDRVLFYRTKNNGGAGAIVGVATVSGEQIEVVTDRALRFRGSAEYPLRRRVNCEIALPPELQQFGIPLAEVKRICNWGGQGGIRTPHHHITPAQFGKLADMLTASAREHGIHAAADTVEEQDAYEEATRARALIFEQAEQEGRSALEVALAIIEACASRPGSQVSSTERVVQHYQTNRRLAESLKLLYQGKCQVCRATFTAKDGDPYAEVHHIKPLTQEGPDASANLLVLCPTCHCKMHYARVRGAERVLQANEIFINGVRCQVYVHPSHVKRSR